MIESLEKQLAEAKRNLGEAKDIVRRFLEDLEHKGIDLQQVPTFEFQHELIEKDRDKAKYGIDIDIFQSVDEELLIQLRDLVRKP